MMDEFSARARSPRLMSALWSALMMEKATSKSSVAALRLSTGWMFCRARVSPTPDP